MKEIKEVISFFAGLAAVACLVVLTMTFVRWVDRVPEYVNTECVLMVEEGKMIMEQRQGTEVLCSCDWNN